MVEHLEEQPLDMERVRGLPGMVIHVVQPEETLWDIAKNHGCACESVRKLNELKDDNLKAGSKLLLVKEIHWKTELKRTVKNDCIQLLNLLE